MMEKYYLFIFLAFISEILGTISGFGSSILFVPIASLFFDFKTVLGITAVFHVFSNLSKIFLFRKGIDKNITLKLGIPAVIFVIIGAILTSYLPTESLDFIMNIALVLLSIFLIIKFNSQLKQSNSNLILGGTFSGLLAGLVGTGGAIRGLLLSAFRLPKDIFIATSALIDLGVDSSRAVVYLANGYFKYEYIFLIPFLIIISILGTYFGKLILKFTSENVFRYLVLGLIIVISLFNTINFLYQYK